MTAAARKESDARKAAREAAHEFVDRLSALFEERDSDITTYVAFRLNGFTVVAACEATADEVDEFVEHYLGGKVQTASQTVEEEVAS